MSDELKIDVKVDADDSQARSKINKLKSELQDEKVNIKINVGDTDIKGTMNQIDKLLDSLQRLSRFDLGKSGFGLENSQKIDEVSKSLARYEKTLRIIADAKKELRDSKDISITGIDLDKELDLQAKTVKDNVDKISNAYKNADIDTSKLINSSVIEELKGSLNSIDNVLDSFNSKFSKAFTINGDSVASLNKIKDVITEINRLTESQKQIFFDMGLDDSKIKLKETKEDIEGINKATKEVDDNSFKGMISSLSKMEDATGKALSQIERLKLSASTEIVSKFSFNEDGIKELDNKTTNINIAKKMKEIVSEYSKHANELMKTQLELDKALNSGASEQYVNELSNKINRITSDLAKVESSADEFKKFPEIFDVLNDSLRKIDDISLENKNLDSIKFLDATKLKESNALLTKAKEAIRDINKYQIDLEKANNAGYNDKSSGIQSAIDERKKDLESYRSELEKNKKAITELSEYEVRKARETSNEIAGIRDKANKQTGTKTVDEQDVLLKKYKDGLLELQRIQKSIVKESVGSSRESKLIQLDATRKDLNNILNQLNDVKREAAKSFEIKIFNNVDRSLIDGLSKVSKEVDKIQDKFTKLGKSDFIDIDSTKFREATKEVERLQNTLSQGLTADVDSSAISKMLEKTEQLKKVSKDLELDIKIGKDADKIEQFTKNTTKNIEQMRREFGDLNGMDLKVFDDLKNLEAGSDKLPSQMKKITQEMSNMSKEMKSVSDSGIKNFFDDLYDSMRTFTLGEIIGDALQEGVYAIKEAVVGLDSAMRDMMKVAPEGFKGTSDELKQVKYDAVEVAKAVGQSTEEVIQGMSKALQTGAKSMSDALEIAKASATFANVGDLDQGQADTYIASIMSAFGGMENALKPVRNQVQGMGKDYNNLTNFLDMANYAGNNFAISTGDVGEALMRSGSVLSGFGVSMSDSIGMIVAANEAVQDSSKVGTGIKSIATNLGAVKASAKDGTIEMNRTAKALREIAGIEVWNKQTGEVKDMTTTLNELNKVWDTSLTQAEKMALAESIGGKQHINTFMALMDNWETVLQYQEEYNQGMMVGSAQREQERYLDSIEGKWNKLRENLKSLTTTVLSSNMLKGLLDGAIAFTDGLNTVFRALDEMNLALPTTIGLITSFAQILKSLSGNGGTSNYLMSMVNGFRNLGNVLKKNEVIVGKTDKSFSRLTKSTDGASKNAVRLSRDYSGLSTATQRIDKSSLSLEKSTTKIEKSFTKTAIGSKVAMVGTTLLNGALVTLAVAGISAAIKAFDDYTHQLENNENKIKDNIDAINQEISANKQSVQYLQDNRDRYSELIRKKEEYAKAGKNLNSEQLAEMEELAKMQQELASMFPELVSGYNADGSPIMAMAGDIDELIGRLERAIEEKNRLLSFEKEKLSQNTIDQLFDGEKGKKGWLEQTKGDLARLELDVVNSGKKINNNLKQMMNSLTDDDTYFEGFKQGLKDQEKAANEHYDAMITAYNEYRQKEMEVQDGYISKMQNDNYFKKLLPDVKDEMSEFAAGLDWINMGSEANMNNWSRGLESIANAAKNGKVDLEDWNKTLQDAHSEYQKTGDTDAYKKSISGIAEEISNLTGRDVSDVFKGLMNAVMPLTPELEKAQEYLKSFGKSLNDVELGDGVAQKLQIEFAEMQKLIQRFADTPLDAENKLNLVTEISSNQDLPALIREYAQNAVKDGEVSNEEYEFLMAMTVGMSEGKLADDTINKLQKLFDGELTEAELKVPIKINDDMELTPQLMSTLNGYNKVTENNPINFKSSFDTKELEKNQKVIEESLSKFKNEEVIMRVKQEGVFDTKEEIDSLYSMVEGMDDEKKMKFISETSRFFEGTKSVEEAIGNMPADLILKYGIEVSGREDVDNLKNDLNALPKDIQTLVQQEVIGYDKVSELKRLYDQFPEHKQLVTDFILGNQSGIDGIKKYDELQGAVKDYIEKKLGISVEGDVQEVKEVNEAVTNAQDGEQTLIVDQQGGEEAKETAKEIESMEGTTNSTVQVQVNGKEDVQEIATKTEEISKGNYKLTLHAETSGAAKNISGLLVRVKEYQSATSSIKSIVFKSETAQSAKNISGLLNRVKEYQTAASSIKTLVFKSETAQAAKNISGLIAKVGEYNKVNPKTLTFKTNANTITGQVNSLANAVRNVPNGKTITYNIKQNGSVPKAPKSMPTPQSTEPMLTNETDISTLDNQPTTPQTRGWGNPLETHKFNLNHYIELENQLKKIASQLDIIDEKAKNAFGQEKINYLKQQEDLLKKQQQLQSQMASEMQKQQQSLKSFLGGKGITFDSDGNISNYHTKLVAMNKELERLEEASKKASDASSNYKGNNDKERDRLSNASKIASDNLSKYKESYDEMKKAMDEYLSLTFDDIPKAKEEWEKLNNAIKDTSNSIEEANKQNKLFTHQNKVKELEYEYDKLTDKLDVVDQKMKHAYGRDKLTLINEQISLMKRQQDIQNQLINSYKQQVSIYRGDLGKYGFQFDNNGDITNLDETLNKFKDHKDLEKVKKLLDEYIKIQRDELPDAVKEWEKLNSTIKDAYKEQLNVTKQMEDKITEIYKQQVEKRKKLIDEELNKRLDALKKEQDAYNKTRDEQDYKKDYDKQKEIIDKLQKEIDIASRDDSLSGQKKLQELMDKLKEEQEKLQDLVQEKIDKETNDFFQDEMDRLEKEAEAEKDRFDKDFSDERIQELVKAALNTGVFEDIDGTMRNLQDVMLEFVDEYGDGLSSIGDLIKNEMIANLEIAKDTMKDLSNIMKELDLKSFSASVGRMTMPDMSRNVGYSESNTNNTIQFNSPLLVVEGNVTPDVMPDLKMAMGQLEKNITNNIVKKMRG
ncbi:MAG: phage tail tape measure protein [Paraclostridium sp.]